MAMTLQTQALVGSWLFIFRLYWHSPAPAAAIFFAPARRFCGHRRFMDYILENERPTGSIPPIDFRKELNDEQFNAVTAAPGPLLVLAGAGSGKTRTLTYRVAWLLGQGVRPGEILLLTFTNKAAREMLHRVQDLTGHTQRVLHMAQSPDGTTVVSAAADESLRFWRVFGENGVKKQAARAPSSAGMSASSIR